MTRRRGDHGDGTEKNKKGFLIWEEGMASITITHEQEEPDEIYVEGTLNDFQGWTFCARVTKEIAWDSAVWTNYAGTRIIDVAIVENGEEYISIPGDYYDNRDVPLQPVHDQMLEQIDRFFGPSPNERVRLDSERNMERDHVFDALSEEILSRVVF